MLLAVISLVTCVHMWQLLQWLYTCGDVCVTTFAVDLTFALDIYSGSNMCAKMLIVAT